MEGLTSVLHYQRVVYRGGDEEETSKLLGKVAWTKIVRQEGRKIIEKKEILSRLKVLFQF